MAKELPSTKHHKQKLKKNEYSKKKANELGVYSTTIS